MKEGKKLVPKLRFPEFRNAERWKLVTLREASVPVTERVGQRKLTPVSISAGIGFVPQAEKFGRDISGNQYQLYTLVRDGDFVFNKGNSLKFPQGCVYLLQGWGQVAAPNVFICFRLKDGYSNGFFQNCFEQNQHGNQLKKHITSGARSNGLLNISKETFFGVEIQTPSPPEQQKIAECLSSVDELMATQARKLDALKTHKKGLMQQLFPCESESQPRLRFPEFQNAGEWMVRKAGALFSNRVTKGEQGLPIYSVTMHDGMVRRDSLDRNYYDIEDAAGNKKVCRNDIAYNMMRMWQGALGVAPEDCLVSPAYIVLAPAKGTVPEFFRYIFKLPATLLTLTAHSRGLTKDRLRLYYDDFARIPLRCPSPDEQQRIADCLTSLDDLIAAQTQKLDALKTHKQALMQQIFPSPEEVEA
ncbi:MAG: restriction endonuclease subunit S [Gammaproteobacteria bacterium]|nr:restriction endonuclease subunit S [Gammaproteobacteria bacterium]